MADFPKDYDLRQMRLISVTGEELDLRYVFVEMNLYEDIWSPTLSGDLTISDAQNLLMNFPIFGFEDLILEFGTPGKPIIKKKFRIYSGTHRELGKDRNLVYVMNFCTPEALNNYKVRVSKSYKGKLISEMVDDLHNNWLGGGDIEIEPSKYTYHYVIPNTHPIQAINWLSTRANPSNYKGANYLYWQTVAKFRFIPIEKCLEQKEKEEIFWQPANIRTDDEDHHKRRINEDLQSIQGYNINPVFNVRENQEQGMYGNELILHNQLTKTWQSLTFDYYKTFQEYKHLYPTNPLYSKKRQDLHHKNNRLKYYTEGHDPTYPFRAEEWLRIRVSQLRQLHNIIVTTSLPGNSNLITGDVVKYEMPSPEPPINNEQVIDKYFRGRFLIVGIRHKLDQKSYSTVLELVKDSVFTAYP